LLLLLATVLLFGLELTVILSGGPDWLGATAGLLSYALAAFAAGYVAKGARAQPDLGRSRRLEFPRGTDRLLL